MGEEEKNPDMDPVEELDSVEELEEERLYIRLDWKEAEEEVEEVEEERILRLLSLSASSSGDKTLLM